VTDPLGALPPPPPEPPDPPEKRPFLPVTYALLASLGLAFLAESIVGRDVAVESNAALMRMGALYLPAVRDGDYWRLGSYAFLHIGWLHIAMNSWSLWNLLPQLELAFGSNLTLGFFSATAIAGGAASIGWALLHGHPMVSAGASGGAFGLFGATIALLFRIRHRFSEEARRSLFRRLLFSLALNLGIAFTFPVDSAAHLGGLVSGLVLAMLAPQRSLPKAWWQKPAQWFIVASVLVLACMEGAAVARAAKPKPRTLRGPGVEAKIDGQLIPVEPGVAVVPGAAVVEISRLKDPLPIVPGQETRQLGGRVWTVEKGKEADTWDVLKLIASEERLQIELACHDPFCQGDKADKLLEQTARTLRTSP
jgi:membrane associated rhomboid family serine protease